MRLYSTTESAKTEEPTKAEESAKAAEQPEVSKFSEELEKALKELEGKKVEARDYKVYLLAHAFPHDGWLADQSRV